MSTILQFLKIVTHMGMFKTRWEYILGTSEMEWGTGEKGIKSF